MCLWWEQSSSITYFPYDCDTFSLSDVSQVQNQLLQILSSCFWHMFSLLKIAEILNVHDNRDHVCFVSEDKTSSLARVDCYAGYIESRTLIC